MRVALRIDDVGASSKRYEIYSKYPGCNMLFLKYIYGLRAWGPYREMTAGEWKQLCDLLRKYNARLTVAITAAWVEGDCSLVPYPKKFPEQAAVLKEGVQQKLLEIANHGLTHCIVGRHLPRAFSSNRRFHREFWAWLPEEVHHRHIKESQGILQDYFQVEVSTFVPPGNIYTEATISAARQFGINLINCQTTNNTKQGIRIMDEEHVFAFHDRKLVLEGVGWLEKRPVIPIPIQTVSSTLERMSRPTPARTRRHFSRTSTSW